MHTHTPVLLQETVDGLNLKKGDRVIDATLGLGGHSEAIAHRIGESGALLGVDADRDAIALAQKRLASVSPHARFALGNFRDIHTLAQREGFSGVQGVVFDLGWNATQLDSGRGFSFKSDDPLLMTFAVSPQKGEASAGSIVNEWSENDLKEMLQTLGEERFASRIVRAIVQRRKTQPIERSGDLADIITSAVPAFYRRGKIHPATRTFQALRMMVNEELSSIERALPQALSLVKPGGRIAVITFHSLEDGLVKRILKKFVQEKHAISITKKPIVPSREEVHRNPRARSAKLRIIEKI